LGVLRKNKARYKNAAIRLAGVVVFLCCFFTSGFELNRCLTSVNVP